MRASRTRNRFNQRAFNAVDQFQASNGRYLPGFGHRFHKVDPRAVRISAPLEEAVRKGTINGRFLRAGRAVEQYLSRKGRSIPMNIDGITAVVLLELGFPSDLGGRIFILSRSVGICTAPNRSHTRKINFFEAIPEAADRGSI